MTTTPTRADTPPADVSVRRGLLGWASPRFYVCVAVLLVSAVGMRSAEHYFEVALRKKPVPLKRPLAAFDWNRLEPRYKPHAVQPPLLNDEMEQALGTDSYLQVRLVDTTRKPSDPTAVANVFITYYTGQPDMVPHVPDECYLAGGYDQVGPPRTVELKVPGVGAPEDKVPVRLLQFLSPDGNQTPTVMYFFHVNGDYRTTRTGVRLRLANLFERYAYYAKIEVTFTDDNPNPLRLHYADVDESLAALTPLLERMLPVLLEDHLGWDRVQGKGEGDEE